MALQGKPVAIGNTATTIYTCPGGTEAAVHGLIFANNTASTLTVDLAFYDQTTGTTVTVATDLSVAANSYITWAKPINMNAGDYIQAISSASSGIVCLFSAYEGSAAPVATGFTARGVWSSASTYAINDIVTVVGTGTYLAIQASTNQNPTSATAYWMFLEGISASALPSQAGQGGKFLTTDGTDASWAVVDVAGGATVTASASADITLSAASTRVHKISFAGSGYKVILPNASTLNEGGAAFVLENKGQFSASVVTSGGTPICGFSPGALIQLYLVDNSTVDGIWQINLGTAQGSFASAAVTDIDTSAGLAGSAVACCQIANNKFLFAYMITSSYTTVYLRVAQFSSGAWTLGTRTSFSVTQGSSGTETNTYQMSLCRMVDDKAVLAHWEKNTSNQWQGRTRVIDVSGTTISIGGNTNFYGGTSNTESWQCEVNAITSSSFTVNYATLISGAWQQNLACGTVAGSSITYGSNLTNLYSGWPGSRVLVESSSLITAWMTGSDSNFGEQVRPYTVSGNTLTSGTNYGPVRGATYYWDALTFAYDGTDLFLLQRYSNDPTYLTRIGRNNSLSPPRWSQSSADGWRSIALSNSLNGMHGMVYYSTSGTVKTLAIVNFVSAGLAGSGVALSFMNFNTSTNVFEQSALSFLIPGNALGNFDNRNNSYNMLMKNSTGDLFLPHKNPKLNYVSIVQLGLTAT